jgi:hypothetical protein
VLAAHSRHQQVVEPELVEVLLAACPSTDVEGFAHCQIERRFEEAEVRP